MSFLLVSNGSLLERDDNLPLEEGRTAGSYSTFFKEFFLINKGFFSLELNSVYEVTAKASRKLNNELYNSDWFTSSSFLES